MITGVTRQLTSSCRVQDRKLISDPAEPLLRMGHMHSALYLKHNDNDDGCQFVMTLQRFSVVRSYFDLLISSFIICVLADAMVVTNDRAKAAASAKVTHLSNRSGRI